MNFGVCKYKYVILIASAAIMLSGCSGSSAPSAVNPPPPSQSPAPTQTRTVIDTELGSLFQNPGGKYPYSEYGAFVGSPGGDLAPQAILVIYGQAFELAPSQDRAVRGFPYAGLRKYEASQVAGGNSPIFVTATYQGLSRPVYWGPSLALSPIGFPAADPHDWQQAVNVGDSRYVNFWITEYAQKVLKGSEWLELDEGTFNYSIYGVLNNDGIFVPGVQWDTPFPQSDTAFLQGVASFYDQVAAYNQTAANPINTATDLGSISQPALFSTVFNGAPAVLVEDIYSWFTNPGTGRNAFYDQMFQLLPWMAAQNKVAIIRAILPSRRDDLLSSFALYSLLKGMNFFFAPGNAAGVSTDPLLWSSFSAALGKPVDGMTSSEPYPMGTGYRLYQREFEGGTVYLNWTGEAQTITPTSGDTYYNPDGNPVTSLAIPDGTGTYLSLAPNNLPMPRISPVYGSVVDGPIAVSITSDTPGVTIRYTTDGSHVGPNSPIYSEPFKLMQSATVQARAFSESASSYSAVIVYKIK